MYLSEALLDFADAEYFANTVELLQVGTQEVLSDQQVTAIREQYPSVMDWFESLDSEGKNRVVEYLHKRHNCFARFSC